MFSLEPKLMKQTAYLPIFLFSIILYSL